MATFRIAVDIAWAYGSGSPGANVWHGRTTGTMGPGGEVEGLIADLEAFYNDIRQDFTNGVTFTFGGEVTGLDDDAGDSFIMEGWTTTGLQPGAALPTSVQMVAGWRTGSGGRSGRGRTFLGPLAESASTAGGLPAPATVGRIATAGADLIAAGSTRGNGSWGVYSPTQNVIRDFTGCNVRNSFGTLRSRRD